MKENVPQEAKNISVSLKSILGQYRVMNATIKRRLNALGFQIVQGKGHYKVYYKDDMSKCCVIPSTASEYRTGRNIASNIYKYLIAPRIKQDKIKK